MAKRVKTSKMSQVTISDVFNHELGLALRTFGYLKPRDLYNCHLVCKDWHQILKEHLTQKMKETYLENLRIGHPVIHELVFPNEYVATGATIHRNYLFLNLRAGNKVQILNLDKINSKDVLETVLVFEEEPFSVWVNDMFVVVQLIPKEVEAKGAAASDKKSKDILFEVYETSNVLKPDRNHKKTLVPISSGYETSCEKGLYQNKMVIALKKGHYDADNGLIKIFDIDEKDLSLTCTFTVESQAMSKVSIDSNYIVTCNSDLKQVELMQIKPFKKLAKKKIASKPGKEAGEIILKYPYLLCERKPKIDEFLVNSVWLSLMDLKNSFSEKRVNCDEDDLEIYNQSSFNGNCVIYKNGDYYWTYLYRIEDVMSGPSSCAPKYKLALYDKQHEIPLEILDLSKRYLVARKGNLTLVADLGSCRLTEDKRKERWKELDDIGFDCSTMALYHPRSCWMKHWNSEHEETSEEEEEESSDEN